MQSRVGGELLLDPTSDESYHEDGAVLMAMMPTANTVTIASVLMFLSPRAVQRNLHVISVRVALPPQS